MKLKVGFDTYKHRAKWRLISMSAAAYRKAVADLIVATTSFCGEAAAVDPPDETVDALAPWQEDETGLAGDFADHPDANGGGGR